MERAGNRHDPGQPRYIGYEFWRPSSARRHPGLPPHLYQILVRSDRPAHPALVTVRDFLAVARMRAQPTRTRPSRTSHAEPALHHRISCAVCGRTMSVSSKNGRIRYRCRPTPDDQTGGHETSVYVAQSRMLAALEPWLHRQSETCPSWATGERAARDVVDAINLQVTFDPRTDSIHVTTGVGSTAAISLAVK